MLGVAAPASAQLETDGETEGETDGAEVPDPTAQARAFFAEGVSHTQAREWEAAADAFTSALALRPAPAIRYNLAAALVELGRYREASAQLAALAPETLPPNLGPLVSELGARIRREAGRLSVERATDLADTIVTLDDDTLDEAELAREIPVTPGPHAVAAIRDGAAVTRAQVSVGAGEHTHVVLAITGTQVVDEPPPPTDITQEWGFWVAIGAGALVFVAVAVIVGISTADSGGADPIVGNFSPGVITWP